MSNDCDYWIAKYAIMGLGDVIKQTDYVDKLFEEGIDHMNKKCWKILIKLDSNFQRFTKQNIKYPTKEMQLEAVKRDGYSIQFILNPDKEVQLAAVERNGQSIQYIFNPDKEIQLAAVKQNGSSIQFIPNPSKEVQLATVKQDGYSIQWILNPCREVLVQYLLKANPEVQRLLADPEFDLKDNHE